MIRIVIRILYPDRNPDHPRPDQPRRPITFLAEVKYFNPFNPEFTIVIFIHYKPRITAAILDL